MALSRKTTEYIFAAFLAVLLAAGAFLAFAYLCLAPLKYREAVRSAAAAYGLEQELVYAVIRAESNFDASAESKAGAKGLMQLLPSTAFFIGGEGADEELFDAERNVALGCKYLRYLSDKFDTTESILAAYNAGEGRVRIWLAKAAAAGVPFIRAVEFEETRTYIKKVKKFYNYYKILYDLT